MMRAKLKREIGFIELVIYGVGVILGAGIYVLIGATVELTGNSVWLSFLIASIIASFTGLSYAELSSMFPRSAAEFIYVKKTFKKRLLAFSIGLLEIFGDVVAVSVVALGFSAYFESLFGVPMILTAVSLIGLFSFVNFWGIKESSRLNILFTSIELLGLLLIIFLGMSHFGRVNYFELPHGFSGLFKAAGLIFFAYLGFEDIVNIGEEVKKPRKTIPKALIVSVIITTLIYILVAVSAVSLVDWKDLRNSNAPLAYIASKSFLGASAFTILSYIALFSTANTVLIFLIVGSRMVYGTAREGYLPSIFSRIHKKRRTPWVAILAVMIVSMIFVFMADITVVANITNFVIFIIFFFVNLSLILLRYKKPNVKRAFKVPINIGKFPLIPFLGLISCVVMLFHFDLSIILVVVSVVVSGLVVYKIWRKIQQERG